MSRSKVLDNEILLNNLTDRRYIWLAAKLAGQDELVDHLRQQEDDSVPDPKIFTNREDTEGRRQADRALKRARVSLDSEFAFMALISLCTLADMSYTQSIEELWDPSVPFFAGRIVRRLFPISLPEQKGLIIEFPSQVDSPVAKMDD